MIVVPKQVPIKNNDREYSFVFQLKKHINIYFKLKYGISFMFTGKFLTHQQRCTHPCDDKQVFFNIASYGNKRLFGCIKK